MLSKTQNTNTTTLTKTQKLQLTHNHIIKLTSHTLSKLTTPFNITTTSNFFQQLTKLSTSPNFLSLSFSQIIKILNTLTNKFLQLLLKYPPLYKNKLTKPWKIFSSQLLYIFY